MAGTELIGPLLAGATIALARPEGHRDPYYLAHLITRQAVTSCHFVPSMLQIFLEEPDAAHTARTLRRIVCSGEELAPALAGLVLATRRLEAGLLGAVWGYLGPGGERPAGAGPAAART